MAATTRTALGLFVIFACCLELAAAAIGWGGATRSKSLKATDAHAAAGDLIFWYTKGAVAGAATEVVTLTADKAVFVTTDDTALTCTATTGGTAVTVTKSETSGTGGLILEVTMGGTFAADAIVAFTCAAGATLAANPAAGMVQFTVKDAQDTTATTAADGYATVAANSATWVSAAPGTLAPSQDPVQLVFKFKPNTEIAATGTVTLTADQFVYATVGSSVVTCTATTTHATTGASAVVTVGTSVVSSSHHVTNGRTLVVTMSGSQQFTLGQEAAITCTGDLAVNGDSGTVVKFDVETSGDTTALTAQTGYTTAAALWGGVTRVSSLVKSETAANSGDLLFYFSPKSAHSVDGLITLTASTKIFTNDEAIVCTAVQASNTIDVEDAASVTSGTGTVLTLKLDTAIVATSVVSVTCPKAELDANGGTSPATVGFTLETSVDTDAVALVPYHIADAKTVTWGSASVNDVNATDIPTRLTVKFTPNTAIAETGTVTLTASQAIFAASNSTCTASTLSVVTGAAAAVGVASSTVTTTGTSAYKVITLTFADGSSNQLATLGRELTIECTTFLAANAASGTAVTFTVVTSGDTVVTSAQTGYTLNSGPTPTPTPTSPTPTPTPASNSSSGPGTASGTSSTVSTTIRFGGDVTATHFNNLVGCAYAKTVSDATTSLNSNMCTASSGPSFTYLTGASTTNTATASRRAGSVQVALKVYHSLLSQTAAEAAVTSVGTSLTGINAVLASMNQATGSLFNTSTLTATGMTAATWTHSSAAVVVPSMMAMFSAIVLVLMQ